jgi:hypothetical protein
MGIFRRILHSSDGIPELDDGYLSSRKILYFLVRSMEKLKKPMEN